MRVGLIDIEPNIVNVAYMQISQYHKSNGDSVEWAVPLEYFKYDKLYCSSIFDFTDKTQVPENAICGGSGFDLTTRLPNEIADYACDYSIYPENKVQLLWLSRGCIRDCPFCIVRQKEGDIHGGLWGAGIIEPEYIKIMDNNFFACPSLRISKALCDGLVKDHPLDFQGVDARIITEDDCKWLNGLRHYKQIKMAWDNPKEDLIVKFKEIIKHIKPYKIMVYVLIGYWSTPEEDLMRVETLRDLGIDPFAMPYDKSDPYQKRFARWVNHKAIFKTVKWVDYK